MQSVLILNGPNLNLLGLRQPEIYGETTLAQLQDMCQRVADAKGLNIGFEQSNHEGDLVDAIQRAGQDNKWVVFNPGAYTHTSIALRDAIIGSNCKVIEVHISNIYAREKFRRRSYISAVAVGSIVGMGTYGYTLAMEAIVNINPA